MKLYLEATFTWGVVTHAILPLLFQNGGTSSVVVAGFRPGLSSMRQARRGSSVNNPPIIKKSNIPLQLYINFHSPANNTVAAVVETIEKEDQSVFPSTLPSSPLSLSPWDINPSIPNSIASIDQIFRSGARRNAMLQTARTSTRHYSYGEGGEEEEDNREYLVNIAGRDMVNFGSCSYLGLETHPSIIEGTCEAAQRYGSQYSSSRAYSSNELYDTLESMLSQIYDNRPVMVTPTTTLGHISTLPVLIGDDDFIILDMQVHNSVQTAAQLLKARNVPLKVIRHNDMDMLETAIKSARANPKVKNIWYLADGVYSMYGDYANFDQITHLLHKYNNFHVYFDDAHGVSWTGRHGCGVVWSQMEHHDRMVLAISLVKSFATSGGAIVFANEAQRSLVRNCGGPMVFSGPVQPPMLGAACASVRLHTSSSEIGERQDKLAELIRFCDNTIASLGLPQYSRNGSPIFFIPVGKPDPIFELVEKVGKDGYYINSAIYPAVAMRRGGLRIVLNHHLTKDHILGLLKSVREHYGPTLRKHKITQQTISDNFNIPLAELTNLYGVEPADRQLKGRGNVEVTVMKSKTALKVEMYKSIQDIDGAEWDRLFFKKGHSSQILSMYESVFDGSTGKPEDRWDFYYFVARNPSGAIVAATFFTQVLNKDDMLSSVSTSKKVEKLRQESSDPYLMSSGAVMIGTPVSSANLLYLDRSSHDEWKEAIRMLAKEMEVVQSATKSSQIILRGLTTASHDKELEEVLLESGFSLMNFFDQFVISNIPAGGTSSDYLATLKYKKRQNLRRYVLNHIDDFSLETAMPESNEEILECYNLYLKVHERSYRFATFPLPYEYFKEMVKSSAFDMIRFYRKDLVEKGPIGMCVSNAHGETYTALVIGFERGAAGEEVNLYDLMLYSVVERAMSLGCTKIDFGYTCGTSKRKLGCDRIKQDMFVQVNDFFVPNQLAAV